MLPCPSRRRLLKAAPACLCAWGPFGADSHGMGRKDVALYCGDALGRYGFPTGHPLGADRQEAFFRETRARGLDSRIVLRSPAGEASPVALARFHTPEYIDFVATAERKGLEFLDRGDTPVFPDIYHVAATVVGSALDALNRIMDGELKRTFQPVGGLHHASRSRAAGFCVFNDIGVVIESLRAQYGLRRIAYVDIDVHHGDGVFYAFEDDPDVVIADIHEDGEHLFPGTGRRDETGKGPAAGTKLNIPLAPGSGDAEFFHVWPEVEAHLERLRPEFVLFQCGADGLAGDPLAHLRYSPQVHRQAARSLVRIADRCCQGRLMAFGGGGYHRANLASAWNNVLEELSP